MEKIFQDLGLSTSEAIGLFYEHVSQNKGLPFSVNVPNAETLQAIMDSRDRKLASLAITETGTLFDT